MCSPSGTISPEARTVAATIRWGTTASIRWVETQVCRAGHSPIGSRWLSINCDCVSQPAIGTLQRSGPSTNCAYQPTGAGANATVCHTVSSPILISIRLGPGTDWHPATRCVLNWPVTLDRRSLDLDRRLDGLLRLSLGPSPPGQLA